MLHKSNLLVRDVSTRKTFILHQLPNRIFGIESGNSHPHVYALKLMNRSTLSTDKIRTNNTRQTKYFQKCWYKFKINLYNDSDFQLDYGTTNERTERVKCDGKCWRNPFNVVKILFV